MFTVTETKDYQLIEFFEEKIEGLLSLDCVPCKWVTYDPAAATCVSKFMPPPYNKTALTKLKRLIQNKSAAPEDWAYYPVHLRGQAETYEEGQKKLEQLKNDKAYAYSTDNEAHAKDKSAYFTKVFEQKSKKTQKEKVDEIMYGSDLEESSSSGPENSSAESLINCDLSDEDESGNIRPKKKKEELGPFSSNKTNISYIRKPKTSTEIDELSVKSKKHTALKKTSPISMITSQNQPENSRPSPNEENVSLIQQSDPSTHTDELNGKSKAKKVTSTETLPIPRNASVSSQSKIVLSSSSKVISKANTEKKSYAQTESRVQDLESDKVNSFSKETLLLHSAIKALTVEVNIQSEQIRELRNCITQTLKIKLTGMTVEDFAIKYKITLKLDTLQALEHFENELTISEQCVTDFTACLKHFVEDEMYKTLLAIFKKNFDRKLAVLCTAVRDTKGKYNMKGTTLCRTLFELACKNCTCESGRPITEKNFVKALGSIFNNAKDWDGQRNVRRLVGGTKRKEKPNNDEPSEN